MVRSNDTFWNYIEDMNDGSMKCKFCGHLFAKGTSISRIKWHLSGETGHGVVICGQVPKEDQEAAFLAMRGSNKKSKSIPSSSGNDVANTLSTPAQEQNHERRPIEMAQGQPVFIGEHTQANDLIGGIELVYNAQETRPITELASQDIELTRKGSIPGELPHAFETIPRTEQVQHLERGSSLERPLINQVDEPRGDSSQPMVRLLEQSNVVDDMAADDGRIRVGFHGVGRERICSLFEVANGLENAVEGSIQHVDRSVSPWRLTVDEHDNRGEATQGRDIWDRLEGESWGKINAVSTFLMDEEYVDNNSERLAQPGVGASSSRVRIYNTSKTRGYPLPTTKLVGREFEEKTNLIWSYLMNDEVSSIGIYGMGGVGKSTMLQHIHNKLQQRRDICHHVYWVTVSQDFSIHKLQNNIARRIGVNLSTEEEELHRAGELSEELKKKQKWILILDDLWNSFELRKVGIPLPVKRCKLIMTTRSKRVCQQMDSQLKIEVKPLSESEAWDLFVEKLGHDTTLPPEVEKIAKSVARECAGLPLGIVTMAGSLKGVHGEYEWRNVLTRLKESKFRDMDKEVFQLLRFSFDRLDGVAIQQCLLYCALFPEDLKIRRGGLINYLIDEEIIKGMGSRQAAFDEGHTMLDKLENVCLLESCFHEVIDDDDDDDGRAVRMHDLIRDMAIQIQQEKCQVIVKAGAQVENLSDIEEWTEKLTRVSLMHNRIEKIPSSYSPRCPNLSTLLLCYNWLQLIAGCFLEQFNGLMVLDLSFTKIKELPASISDLVSLTSLLLIRCKMLRNVPSLEKLKALKRLDLFGTSLQKMPQGMECLTNLRYIRMGECDEMVFPSGILPKLSLLQVFVLEDRMYKDCCSTHIPITVVEKEVGCLRKLERLKCHFEDYSYLLEFFKSRNKSQLLKKYRLFVGQFDGDEDEDGDGDDFFDRMSKSIEMEIFTYRRKTVCLGNLRIDGDRDFKVMLPKDIQQLIIYKCLCDVSSLINYATELEVIHIWDCNSMEWLVSSSWFCSAPQTLPSYNGIFSGLKKFDCYKCKSMKKLFPPMLLPNLVNLEEITVRQCEKMEEIIGIISNEEGVTSEESNDSNTKFSLPKLTSLLLWDLPKLKSICSAKLICNSLQEIYINDCQKMKRIPIFLPSPHPSLQRMYIHPKKWWDSVVEWEHPNTKEVFLPFVRFD